MAEDKSKIDQLDESLYSRTSYDEPKDERRPLAEGDTPAVEEGWKSENLDDMLKYERRTPDHNSFMKKIFLLAVAFFVVAIGVAGYIFWGGANFVSSKNVDITVLGPSTISAGNVLELGVIVANKNNSDLEVANLSVQYPTGTRDPVDTTQSLTYHRESLGEIRAGSEVTRNASAILFGERGEVKQIKVSFEYKVKGSNATFYKEKIFEISIGESPVTMTIEKPPLITSGEVFSTTITLTANTSEVIENLMVRAEYPYGFLPTGSTPKAVVEDNTWFVGVLNPGESKKIVLEGKLIAENDEERTFRFYMGIADPGSDGRSFKTNIASQSETLAISRPGVGLSFEFNSVSSSVYTAPAATEVRAALRFQNNLPDKIFNPELTLTMTGSVDKSEVRAEAGGFYDSGSSRIIWDLDQVQSTGDGLSPGENGRVSFSFSTLPPSTLARNENVTLQAVFTGLVISDERQVPVSVSETGTVKIASLVSMFSKSLYSRGPFTNTGLLPPKAEQTTTYTAVMTLGNTQNDVENGKVTAVLGQNVKWLGKTSPSGEDVSYNPNSNTVTWNVGALKSGSGFSLPAREVAFQVALTPSLSQVGTAPVLVGNIAFTGTDIFINKTVVLNNDPITTRISTDPKFIQGNEIVVK